MEAHTLNAWTRFALQKGGIGSCTALVDNPATEPEDLMFMTGEKIIVLRRLEKDEAKPAASASRSQNGADDENWFLGYCEGVVGKFRASHVKIHGKLKKPVLMRRSGQGQIRESSTKFMSQAAAATLPESQVPVGIPVTSVDSEGEESSSGAAARRAAAKTASSVNASEAGSIASHSHSVDIPSRDRSPQLPLPSSSPSNGPLSRTPTQATAELSLHSTAGPASRQPPRARQESAASLDSDNSETVLPWARPPSTSSSGEAASSAGMASQEGSSAKNGLSEHSSPSDSSGQHSRALPSNHSTLPTSSSQDSIASSVTDDSEDDESSTNHRRDYTFSIYDVYGRDSVAFPNFNLKHLSKSYADSSTSLSSAHPSPPIPDGFKAPLPRDPRAAPTEEVAAKLRYSPSSRRPNAAPDPRAPPNTGRALASSLRQQVEASNSRADAPPPPMSVTSEECSPVTPQDMTRFPHYGPDSYDPRRRPSGPPAPGVPPTLSQLRMPDRGAQSSPSSPHAPQGIPRPGQPLPSGFLPTPVSETGRPSLQQPQPQHAAAVNGAEGPVSGVSPTGSYSPAGINPNASALRPVRSSSDRSSERERVGSGQLRKNPSNPSPGSYGGGAMGPRRSAGGLSPPPGTNGSASRTPSPLNAGGAPSPTSGLPPPTSAPLQKPSGPVAVGMRPTLSSPIGSASGPSSSRGSNVAPSPTSTVGGGPPGPQHRYDAKGFILGAGPPCRAEAEDREAVEKWTQVLAENDLPGAKKSRKVRKLVQAGIPSSMRGKVWLFLANAGVRRRPGLFEKLCMTSQEAKGKKGKEALYEAIEKDVARTLPENKYFQEGRPGRADLEAILKSYAHYNPIIGYTQGMGMLVAGFLLHMPPEDAFWMLCATLRDIHMEGYYSNDMKQMHIDGVMFGQLLQTMDRELAAKLASLEVEPLHFTPNWFLPLYCRILPWPTLFPVWDVFFYEGPTWILQVALAVVRIIREPLMATSGPDAREECLRLLIHPPPHELTTANVLTSGLSVKLKEGEIRKLSRSASKLVRESGVLHGTRSGASGPSNGSGPGDATAPARR